MIHKISFQNYKAFEKGEIELKPITILLGANSVGKSSIINLLLMLQQTANATNCKSALKLNGESIGMGECENIFRNRDTSKNLILEFDFSDKKLFDMLNGELMKGFIDRTSKPMRFLNEKERTEYRATYLSDEGKNVFTDKELFQTFVTQMLKLRAENYPSLSIDNSESFIKNYDFLKFLPKVNQEDFILSLEIKYIEQNDTKATSKSKLLKVEKVTLQQASGIVLSIELSLDENKSSYKATNVISDFADCTSISNELQEELLREINFDSTIFSVFPPVEKKEDYYGGNCSFLLQTIFQIFSQAMDNVKSQFKTHKSINHISPLRAYPQRYYFLDKANINTYLNSLDGNSLTEILKENKDVREAVNKWLKKFLDIEVNVNPLHDVIHTLKIKQSVLNFDLDVTDIGFGISQILPVIVEGFMSEENSITMIEQPEIHLHPKLQADLADLFIDIINLLNQNAKKCLLIETHSEYLLRRLRRRIAEEKISANDVAIYFIEPPKSENGSAEIQPKKVLASGYFDYPEEFMDENLEQDMISFISQQIKK